MDELTQRREDAKEDRTMLDGAIGGPVARPGSGAKKKHWKGRPAGVLVDG